MEDRLVHLSLSACTESLSLQDGWAYVDDAVASGEDRLVHLCLHVPFSYVIYAHQVAHGEQGGSLILSTREIKRVLALCLQPPATCAGTCPHGAQNCVYIMSFKEHSSASNGTVNMTCKPIDVYTCQRRQRSARDLVTIGHGLSTGKNKGPRDRT